jgi:hypothetical protein
MENQTLNEKDEVFGEVIYSYTRAQAIKDGELVDVSSVAKEAGIKFPATLTRAVWEKYVEVPKGVIFQDEQGRLWDIVWMLKMAIHRSGGGDTINFQVYVRNSAGRPRLETLKAICGPGDNAEPVITIMLPNED